MKFKLLLFLSLFLLLGCVNTPKELEFKLNPGVDTINLYDEYTDPGAVAIYDQEELVVTVIENTVNTDEVGRYHIIYEVIHDDKSYTLKRTVDVVLSEVTLSLNSGIDTIRLNESWVDSGITVNTTLDFTVEVMSEVNAMEVGFYTVTYHVFLSDGRVYSIVRMVNVIE